MSFLVIGPNLLMSSGIMAGSTRTKFLKKIKYSCISHWYCPNKGLLSNYGLTQYRLLFLLFLWTVNCSAMATSFSLVSVSSTTKFQTNWSFWTGVRNIIVRCNLQNVPRLFDSLHSWNGLIPRSWQIVRIRAWSWVHHSKSSLIVMQSLFIKLNQP